MIIRSQNIECDVFTQTAKPVHFVQGEKGREIMFTFVNSAIPIEDEPQPIPLSGLTATIHILKPDGNFIIDNMTISGNAALYVLTENACAAGGAGVYDVSLSRGSDVVYTAHGAYVGDFRAISDDVVNSVSDAYGVTFPEGFQEKLVAGEHITIEDNVISSEGERYTAGDNVQISEENVISATDTQYTAGDNINISQQNVISATSTYKRDVLFNYPSGYVASGEITLNHSILDYDDIEFIAGVATNADRGRTALRINAQYFYDTFKYTTAHSLDHYGISFWYDMAVDITLGQGNDPTKLNFYNQYGSVSTAIYQINGIKY